MAFTLTLSGCSANIELLHRSVVEVKQIELEVKILDRQTKVITNDEKYIKLVYCEYYDDYVFEHRIRYLHINNNTYETISEKEYLRSE